MRFFNDKPIKVMLTTLFFTCCNIVVAQHILLDKTLKDIYSQYKTVKANDFDVNKKVETISLVNEQNYKDLSDSAKYAFHFFNTELCHDRNDSINEKIHIDSAVKLRESSIGILEPEYIFLLMEQGVLTESQDIDRAINIFQKAILVSQTLLYNPKLQNFNYPFQVLAICYGNILNFLAELYERKGWTTRIEELYKTAFRFRTYYSSKDASDTYMDINSLSNYYQKKNEINKSIELLKWELDDIKENGYYGSSSYVNALYHLGSAYSKENQDEKALDTYRTAVKLALDSLAGEDETLFYLYGNYCVKLAELNQTKELDVILPIAQRYYSKIDSINTYADILFLITDRLFNNRNYGEANKYCDSLLQYPSYHTGYEEVIYSKKALTSYMCEKPDTALKWQNKALTYCLKNNGENSIIYTNYLADLAFLYNKNSMKEESLTAYLKLIELLERNDRDTIPFYNQKINEICELYNESNHYELVYPFLIERQQKSAFKYGTNTLYYAWICNTLSILEMNTGRLVEAKENNKEAERIYLRNEGKKSLNYAVTIHNKGRILMLEGKYKQALKYLLESKEVQLELNGNVFENTELYIQEINNIIN